MAVAMASSVCERCQGRNKHTVTNEVGSEGGDRR